jgi:5-methylcytosine-specific restriction endonuclease McrA
MRRWRANNPEARLARDRAYKERHPEQQKVYLKRYRLAHPEIKKAVDAARRAREVLAGGRFAAKEWRNLVEQHASQCAYCGARAPREAEHRTPLSRGRRNSIDSIFPACGLATGRKPTAQKRNSALHHDEGAA